MGRVKNREWAHMSPHCDKGRVPAHACLLPPVACTRVWICLRVSSLGSARACSTAAHSACVHDRQPVAASHCVGTAAAWPCCGQAGGSPTAAPLQPWLHAYACRQNAAPLPSQHTPRLNGREVDNLTVRDVAVAVLCAHAVPGTCIAPGLLMGPAPAGMPACMQGAAAKGDTCIYGLCCPKCVPEGLSLLPTRCDARNTGTGYALALHLYMLLPILLLSPHSTLSLSPAPVLCCCRRFGGWQGTERRSLPAP